MTPFQRAAIAVAALLIASPALCQTEAPTTGHTPHAVLHAVRVDRAPAIDGHLTDEGWTLAEPATDFTQRDPETNKIFSVHDKLNAALCCPPTVTTYFKYQPSAITVVSR